MNTDDIQNRLTLHIVEYLLSSRFRSKKVLAEQLNIPYRALLRLCHGEQSARDVQGIMCGIAQYCLRERISPTELFRGFSSI